MVPINLDLDTLRTLMVAHDRGGLAKAAEYLGRTPSAISLQMKRLQDELSVPIFRKRGRGLALTEAGEVALAYARRILAMNDELLNSMQGANLAGRIRIGCPQDFSAVLPNVLSQFTALYPRMQIELRVEGIGSLLEAIGRAGLDLAVLLGHDNQPNARTVGHLDLVWIASSTFALPDRQPLPLAMLGPQCVFRRCAVQRLEAANIPYRIAAHSPSLNGLWAALLGGVGLTARTAINLPDGLTAAKSLHGLPALGRLPVTLHRHPDANGVAADRMASLLTMTLEQALQPKMPPSPITHKRRSRVR